MAKPLVAIVGRPNVGKSTFFNRIIGQKTAIIEDTPGVTRDRIYGDAEWLGRSFTLIDTGGIDLAAQDIILSQMREQAQIAIDSADVILYFVDARQGMVAEDVNVADMLRRTDKPVITVVNKADNPKQEQNAYEFYSLGLGEVFAISAEQGLGLGDLLDAVVAHFGDSEEEETENRLKIAFVGKPNVGKSSLTNKILGETRTIVSDVPGTTRDAIDSFFEKDGRQYVLIDTAGMRKKGRIEEASIERYSVIRALGAIRRADVVVVMLDAAEGVTEQDVKIAGYVDYEGRPCVVAVNKWDAVEKDTHTMNRMNRDIDEQLQFMPYAQRVYLSAKTGQRIDKLFALAHEAWENSGRRITTGLLNDCVREAVTAVPPPADKGRRLKLFYATQAGVHPPTFVLFVNDSQLMHFSYKRYLENYLRKTFGFAGTPIRIVVRERNESGEN